MPLKKKKAKGSKLNITLTVLLVLFVCLLSFSVGVISGKGLSDREYALQTIDDNSEHAKKILDESGDGSPLSDDLTEKEVEILTAKALDEARKEGPETSQDAEDIIAEIERLDKMDKMAATTGETPKEKRDVANIRKAKTDRSVQSLPKVTMPKPSSIEYTVQVAAYQTELEAENHAERLIQKGFPAFPVKVVLKGKNWYRVSIGSFKSKRAAIKYHKSLKGQIVVKTSFVQKITRQ